MSGVAYDVADAYYTLFMSISKMYFHLISRMCQGEIYIDDTPGIGVNELLTKARYMKTAHNVGLIIVDYLQLITESKSSLGTEEISIVSRSLKTLAKELGISIIVLSQLHTLGKRKKSERKRPERRDMRGTG